MTDAARQTVTAEHVAAPPAAVWDALTSDEGFSSWSGPGSRIEPHPGGRIDTPDEPTGCRRAGAVEEVDVHHRLRYRWWPVDEPDLVSTVDIVLESSDEGTRLTVTERLVATTRPAASARAWRARMAAQAHRVSCFATR